jgi:hypothetical protein
MMPFALGDAMPERECRICPPYIVRCGHFEDSLIAISDNGYVLPDCDCPLGRPFEGFLVGVIRGVLTQCPRAHCQNLGALTTQTIVSRHTETRAEADAAFAEFEARLLGREVSP